MPRDSAGLWFSIAPTISRLVDSRLNSIQLLLGHDEAEEHARLLNSIHTCLSADVAALRWHDADHWNGDPSGGEPTPTD